MEDDSKCEGTIPQDGRMPRSIDIAEAQTLLRSRAELLDLGYSERGIRARIDDGRMVRVRRGWYVEADAWTALLSEGRHLLQVLAVDRDSVSERPVFCDVSAAVLLGLPLYRTAPTRVHVAGTRGRTRSQPDVLRHETSLRADEFTEVQGLLCTSPHQTVLDVARTLRPEAALACADAALRSIAVDGQVQDMAAAEAWRAGLSERANGSRARGIRQARRVIAFADGRAQLPGESVSRLQLHRLGFRRVGLQVAVTLPDGERTWVDFELEEAEAFGEFDGMSKYLDEAMRGGRSIAEVLLAEKRREDAIRGVTGKRFVRWETEHIRTPETLRARLAAFGVHPPGR